MAVFQVDLYSKSLSRRTSFSAIIPLDVPPGIFPAPPEVFKPVYLLHGYTDSHTGFMYSFPLQELAIKHNVAFILPDGENSFYLNDYTRNALYEDYITDELPEFVNKVFPLSKKREDITISGISMGGFGAIHCGLAHPELYGNILSFSAALITDGISKLNEGESNPVAPYEYYRHTFGDLKTLLGSRNDPKALAACLKPEEAPRIFMCCGTDDFLYNDNLSFHETLESLGIAHAFVEERGMHEWEYWNRMIPRALEWMEK
jgi:S-formylglutathione hydrolase FrmB